MTIRNKNLAPEQKLSHQAIMSYFSEALRSTLTNLSLPAYRLARDAGVASSTVTLYLNGHAVPSPPKLAALLRALPLTEHAPLIIGRLRDDIPEGWSDTVILRSQPDSVEEPVATYITPADLSPELRSAIEHLTHEAIHYQEVRDLLMDLSAALGRDRSKES